METSLLGDFPPNHQEDDRTSNFPHSASDPSSIFHPKDAPHSGPVNDENGFPLEYAHGYQDDYGPIGLRTTTKGIRGAYQNIALALVATTVPFIVIMALLLHFVFAYRVERGEVVSPDLQLPGETVSSSDYFVNFSATKLTTLASWASTVAALLPGVIMTLGSYHLAKSLMRQSEGAKIGSLPTPYQLGLLLDVLDGKLMSLWRGLNYSFWRRSQKFNIALRLGFMVLVVAFILSYSIWAVDTWFHVTVSTVSFSQTSSNATKPAAFGYQLPSGCDQPFMPFESDEITACTTNVDKAAADAYQIMSNVSSTHQVLTSTKDGSHFSFLAPNSLPSGLDFQTSTVAVGSTCQIISQQCNLTHSAEDAEFVIFNCSANFHGSWQIGAGTVPEPTFPESCLDNHDGCVGLFADSNLNFPLDVNPNEQSNIDVEGENPPNGSLPLNPVSRNYANPFYAGVAAQVFTLGAQRDILESDPHISMFSDHRTSYFILSCEINIYNLTYSWVNNTVTSASLTLSDDNVAHITRSGFDGIGELDQWAYTIQLATVQSPTSEGIATHYAPNLEKIILAFSAGAWDPFTNTEEQIRQDLLVARVPKAPLFTLLVLCLLYILLGFAFTVVALASQPTHMRDVQARLSIYSIIASRFESAKRTEGPVHEIEDLFEERNGESPSTRVGIIRSRDGGWNYSSSHQEMSGVETSKLVH